MIGGTYGEHLLKPWQVLYCRASEKSSLEAHSWRPLATKPPKLTRHVSIRKEIRRHYSSSFYALTNDIAICQVDVGGKFRPSSIRVFPCDGWTTHIKPILVNFVKPPLFGMPYRYSYEDPAIQLSSLVLTKMAKSMVLILARCLKPWRTSRSKRQG